MSPAERYLLAALALLLAVLAVAAGSGELPGRPLHRHRHRHELGHRAAPTGHRGWTGSSATGPRRRLPEDDYEDYEEDGGGDEEDYSAEPRRPYRGYAPKRAGHHVGRHEQRHPGAARYRYRDSGVNAAPHRGRGRDVSWARRYWAGSKATAHRKRYQDDAADADGYDEDVDRYDGHRRRLPDNGVDDDYDYYYGKHHSSSQRRRAHPKYEPRRDWRYKVDEDEDEDDYAYAYDSDDEDDEADEADEERPGRPRKYGPKKSKSSDDDWLDSSRRGNNKLEEWLNESKFSGNASSKLNDLVDAGDDDANLEDEVDDIWKEIVEDKESQPGSVSGRNDESLDAPFKTYDALLRHLRGDSVTSTTSRPVTTSSPRPTTQIKRDAELERSPRRDYLYGSVARASSPRRRVMSRRSKNFVETTTADSWRELLARKAVTEKKGYGRFERKKSSANEENEDRIQADANMDYIDDENDEDNAPASTDPTTSTTTEAATTTTTTQAPPARHNPIGTEYQQRNENPTMSEHSRLKWEHLGTRESVKETRNYIRSHKEKIKDVNHTERLMREGSCRSPRIKVIPIQKFYPNTSLSYLPHCAILHRCSDDTGCCNSERLTCQAKTTEVIELYYYIRFFNNSEVKQLSFLNHTECECVKRRDFGINETLNPNSIHTPVPQNITRHPAMNPCFCPTDFKPNITINNICECTCEDNKSNCWKFKRGEVKFSSEDITCIKTGKCSPPRCSFGNFQPSLGKCPKKKDVFRRFANRSSTTQNSMQKRSIPEEIEKMKLNS